jgi:quinol monooxygenase YgiN
MQSEHLRAFLKAAPDLIAGEKMHDVQLWV